MLLDDALDAADGLLYLLGRLADLLEVVALDADDERRAASRQHLPDPLLQVRLHVPVDPRVALDDLLHLGERLVVVGRRIDADPVLAEVDADHLVREQRLADVGAAVANARDRPKLLAGPDRDPRLLGPRRARLRQPVHQEVPLLEIGQERLPEERHDRGAGRNHRADRDVGASGRRMIRSSSRS